jgi:hypothetical protein
LHIGAFVIAGKASTPPGMLIQMSGIVVIVPRQDPRHTSACALTDPVQLGRWPTTGNTNPSFPEKKIFSPNLLTGLKK